MSFNIAIRDQHNKLDRYGLLYNWYAATDVRGISPIGWHIPTLTEMQALIGVTSLKLGGYLYWDSPNTGGSYTSTLKVKGAGIRNGIGGAFIYLKIQSRIMTSTVIMITDYISIVVFENTTSGAAVGGTRPKNDGLSIRCIRDTNVGWITGEQVQDYDGNVYNTVQIGSYIFTVENLQTTHYNNGDAITEVTDNSAWAVLTTEALCAYNNNWSYVY